MKTFIWFLYLFVCEWFTGLSLPEGRSWLKHPHLQSPIFKWLVKHLLEVHWCWFEWWNETVSKLRSVEKVAVWVDSKESCPWLQVWWFSCVFEDSKLIGRRLSCLDCVVAVCFMNWQKWWWGLIFTCITTSDQLPQSILQDNSRTMLSMNPLVRNKLALCLWVACWMYFESPVFFVLFWFSVVPHLTLDWSIKNNASCVLLLNQSTEFWIYTQFSVHIQSESNFHRISGTYNFLCVGGGGVQGAMPLGRGWGTESPIWRNKTTIPKH